MVAVVLNADGTRNSCEHRAQPGDRVSVFLNGTGVNIPGGTRANPGTLVPLQPAVTSLNTHVVERTVSVLWAPLGVWQVDVRLDTNSYAYSNLAPCTGTPR